VYDSLPEGFKTAALEDTVRNLGSRWILIAGMACFGISGTAMASAIGSANLTNCINGGFTISVSSITWLTAGTAPNTGCFNTGIPTSVSYSGGTVSSGATGNIKNLSLSGSVDQFMTIQGTSPLLDFVLTGFGSPGTTNTACDATNLHSCIIAAGSPFSFTNNTTGVAVGLSAEGTITDGGVTNQWIATFQAELVGTTDAAVQTTLLGDGSISSTYLANLTINSQTATPEPGTVALFLAGGIAFFGIGRRRRKQ
jgi:hypothetical protein